MNRNYIRPLLLSPFIMTTIGTSVGAVGFKDALKFFSIGKPAKNLTVSPRAVDKKFKFKNSSKTFVISEKDLNVAKVCDSEDEASSFSEHNSSTFQLSSSTNTLSSTADFYDSQDYYRRDNFFVPDEPELLRSSDSKLNSFIPILPAVNSSKEFSINSFETTTRAGSKTIFSNETKIEILSLAVPQSNDSAAIKLLNLKKFRSSDIKNFLRQMKEEELENRVQAFKNLMEKRHLHRQLMRRSAINPDGQYGMRNWFFISQLYKKG